MLFYFLSFILSITLSIHSSQAPEEHNPALTHYALLIHNNSIEAAIPGVVVTPRQHRPIHPEGYGAVINHEETGSNHSVRTPRNTGESSHCLYGFIGFIVLTIFGCSIGAISATIVNSQAQ